MSDDLDPSSCFDLFSNFDTYGINVPCLLLIVGAWVLIAVAIAVSLYFLITLLIKGTPKRVARRKEEEVLEASTEATAIMAQLTGGASSFVQHTIHRRRLFLFLPLFLVLVHSQSITVDRIRAQLDCNQSNVICAGREQTASQFDITVNLPVAPDHLDNTFENRWMVVPFNIKDILPGTRLCTPDDTGLQQCFLLNNGTGVGVKIEVGTFRLVYTMSSVPDHTFPADYFLETTPFTGHECNASADPSTVYYENTGCIAASCSCIDGNYSQVMQPLLPECGIFSFRRPFPELSTWIRITLTVRDNVHVTTIPIVRSGQRARSPGGAISVQVLDFVTDLRGKFPLPRLTGGIVVCDWPQKIDSEWTSPDRARVSPGTSPQSQEWYYVDSKQRLDAYQQDVCGHNGVSSADIYSSDAFCCTTPSYADGACIPDPTPSDILLLNDPAYVPPRPGGRIMNSYWPYSDSKKGLHLLRDVEDFEVPSNIAPNISFRVEVSADVAFLSGRQIIPGVDLRSPECSFFYPDNIGALKLRLCNAAYHKIILPLEQIRLNLDCDGLDSVDLQIIDTLKEIRQKFNTARCADINFRYNFNKLPSNLNISLNFTRRVIQAFRLNCNVNVTLKAVQAVEDVIMRAFRGIQCIAVFRDSREPAYFSKPAVALKDAKKPPCNNNFDIMCQMDRGTLDQDWFGIFFIVVSLVILIFTTTFFPIYTKRTEEKNRQRYKKLFSRSTHKSQ